MTRIPADRVYETAVRQLGGSSGSSGCSGLSGSTGSNSTNQTNEINKTNETNQRNQTNILSGVTIFLDRDGTLNPDPGYIRSPDQFELFPGVAGALARLKRAGAQLILVTNQSGIARGFLSAQDLERIHDKLRHLLNGAGASLDAVYFCPHHPDAACGCRKPETGMIEQAVRERQVDLARSYYIGDHARDMQLARRIGARSVLVTSGKDGAHTQAELAAQHLVPDAVQPALPEAVEWILADVLSSGQPSAQHGIS
jgi:heptosyltransferase-2